MFNKKKTSMVLTVFVLMLTYSVAKSYDVLGVGFSAPTVTDRTKVYNPQAGDVLYDSTDQKFYGYDQSGSWQAFAATSPAGSILAFGGASAPSGYLPCDGSAVSRTTYSGLYTVIGNSFGSGDGSTTFNLPDLRGRFLRGVDGSAGVDPDKASRTAMATGGNTGNAVGSIQADEFYSHTHSGNGSNFVNVGGSNNIFGTGTYGTQNTTTAATGGNETRPKNANVNFIIKY